MRAFGACGKVVADEGESPNTEEKNLTLTAEEKKARYRKYCQDPVVKARKAAYNKKRSQDPVIRKRNLASDRKRRENWTPIERESERERDRLRRQTPAYKEKIRAYRQTPAYKECHRKSDKAYAKKPGVRKRLSEKQKNWRLKNPLDPAAHDLRMKQQRKRREAWTAIERERERESRADPIKRARALEAAKKQGLNPKVRQKRARYSRRYSSENAETLAAQKENRKNFKPIPIPKELLETIE